VVQRAGGKKGMPGRRHYIHMKKLVREHINEITLDGSHLDRMNVGHKATIMRWLDEMEIKNYRINDDMSVNVDGVVDLSKKNLTSIPIQFNRVNGTFSCYDNNLTSLDGCPMIVNGDFSCSWNSLTSLEGSPTQVDGDFLCIANNKTFSVKYVEEFCKVKGDIFT
jgi:hypothetical protein